MINKQHHDQMASKFLGSSSWLIDTRASHHVTGNAKVLTNVQPIYPCPVDLPK